MHAFSLWIWSTYTISQIKVEYLHLLNILSQSRFEYRGSFFTLHAYVPITYSLLLTTVQRAYVFFLLIFCYFISCWFFKHTILYKVIPFPEEERIVQSIYGLWYDCSHLWLFCICFDCEGMISCKWQPTTHMQYPSPTNQRL